MRRLLRSVAAALTALVALGVLAACASGGTNDPDFQFRHASKIGTLYPVADRKPVQNFTGSLLAGGKTSIGALDGHVAVVNWFASWCGPCKVETPQYEAMYRQLKASGVRFLGIDFKDDNGAGKSFVQAHGVTYPVLFDYPGASIVKLGNIAAQGPPFTMLLDKQHRVAAVYLLRMSQSELRPAIDKLLAEH